MPSEIFMIVSKIVDDAIPDEEGERRRVAEKLGDDYLVLTAGRENSDACA